MELNGKLSTEIIPWNFHGRFSMKFHVGKNTKIPWRLYGIPCGILHGIIMKHDRSPLSFHVFAHVKLPWKNDFDGRI